MLDVSYSVYLTELDWTASLKREPLSLVEFGLFKLGPPLYVFLLVMEVMERRAEKQDDTVIS